MTFPDIRRDPLTDRVVIIAPERARRPIELGEEAVVIQAGIDPFLEGNEALTSSEVLAVRPTGTPPDTPGWLVRVVPNRYPALRENVEQGGPAERGGFCESQPGCGVHDVIIECPHGETHLGRLPAEQIARVLECYRERLRQLAHDERLQHALVFKNQGPRAGASLPHAHSQLMALPFVPPTVRQKLDRCAEHHRRHGRSLFADWIEEELGAETRIVAATDAWVWWTPFASRFSWENWIVPRNDEPHFANLTDEALASLAALLKRALGQLETAAGDPDYNLVLNTAPLRGAAPGFRWHLEILPRFTGIAGFEWGTGCFINPFPPEEAAVALREVGPARRGRVGS